MAPRRALLARATIRQQLERGKLERGGASTRPYISMNPKKVMQSIENGSAAGGLAQLVGILIIGQPVRHRALSVYPLRADPRAAAAHYLVLDDAIKSGAFRITEVSE